MIICSNIYEYIKVGKKNFNYKDFINRYELYENNNHKKNIYRHLTREKKL